MDFNWIFLTNPLFFLGHLVCDNCCVQRVFMWCSRFQTGLWYGLSKSSETYWLISDLFMNGHWIGHIYITSAMQSWHLRARLATLVSKTVIEKINVHSVHFHVERYVERWCHASQSYSLKYRPSAPGTKLWLIPIIDYRIIFRFFESHHCAYLR